MPTSSCLVQLTPTECWAYFTFVHNHIRDLRKALGLSQDHLADQVNVTRQTIIALERGHYDSPSARLALHLALALHCTVEEVFHLEDCPRTVDAH